MYKVVGGVVEEMKIELIEEERVGYIIQGTGSSRSPLEMYIRMKEE